MLNQENQLLLKKLRHVRLKNKQLEYDVVQLHDKLHEQKKCLPACVTRKDVQIQTEFHWYHKGDGVHHKEHDVLREHARVLQMYNELKKRYNKEVKANQRQNETVAMLSGKINDLEHQLHLANQKINALECKKKDKFVPIQRRMSSDKCMCKKKGSCSCKYLDQLLFETQRLKMENETLSKERRMLKNELAALDKDFFDEIEDLKYALQEAIKLNTHYEKCLKQLSSTYGNSLTSTMTAGNPRTSLWK
ncbi:centrosomal protein of 290 kDa-like isoform X2 [Ahaetulla prasina]|uniref:centrosomal protein of 290 kDa-like isoform X2 n=1 Tax=Ahaetulla prasina TaxID=499056 RepID=UPI0026481B17|nr:centrosomal protein of 290 kDa-like isoform X2 [Ahaetulla prasina]